MFRSVIVLVMLAALAACGRDPAQVPAKAPADPARAEPAGAAAAPAALRAIGAIDRPVEEAVVGPAVTITGWALDPSGIDRIEVTWGETTVHSFRAIARPDVAAAKPGYPDSARAGFEWKHTFGPELATRLSVTVIAVGRSGHREVLGRRSVIAPKVKDRWKALAPPSPADSTPFHFLMALSALPLGAAREVDTQYAAYASSTVRVGMRVPILYLRTTLGAKADWVFDPDWNIERRCGDRRIAEDSLGAVIAHARSHRVPVLFTLNGGIWADASCDVPEWDINDELEKDPGNCQWNEKGEVMADDYLKHLPGSQDAPELARSLSFNVYAARVRHYKKRNLQQAGRLILAFAREHPDLFVGINLDPDTYLNPFFDTRQWYDYNPDTLRQFRHWLAGSGPYAGRPERGVRSLVAYRRERPLSLAQVNRLAGRSWKRWDEVDPPRHFPRSPEAGRPEFWNDPWTHEWEVFRRHLVDLHYDELSEWLAAIGIDTSKIFSSQGFMAPAPTVKPFAVRLTSETKDFDSGGMSVEGAIPRAGHLGAILYGPAAVNDIRMETPWSLFETFARMDPGWAVVEFHNADLRNPKAHPTYASAYRSFRDLFNYGARYVSPMAWNGSNGAQMNDPGYVTFTAWRNTPAEDAMRDFALTHADLPIGSRLWTFGTPVHADGDGWTASQGSIRHGKGFIEGVPERGVLVLESPAGLYLRARTVDRLVIALPEEAGAAKIEVDGRDGPTGSWRSLSADRGEAPVATTAGRMVALRHPGPAALDRIRVRLEFAEPTTGVVRIGHVALVAAPAPVRPPRSSPAVPYSDAAANSPAPAKSPPPAPRPASPLPPSSAPPAPPRPVGGK